MSIPTTALSPVFIGADAPGALTRMAMDAAPNNVETALELGARLSEHGVRPGVGETADLWSALSSLAAHDLEVARAIEPQLDASAILQEADAPLSAVGLGRTWGVFAAEGADPRVTADEDADGWRLTGVKPWCSLADRLDAALVTAWIGDSRGLFAVRLTQAGVSVDTGVWRARGLVDIPSGPVTFDRVPAVPIGAPGWYLSRSGFAWGGIGVAACWYGGAVGIARTVLRQARSRPASETVDTHLGAIDEVLTAARLALSDAATRIDAAAIEEPALLASRVRGIVVRACEEVLWRAGHAMGPGPLATDAEHAQRVADLQLYIRQHHAERDQGSLGAGLRDAEAAPW
jgi:alkylation response protein AidB-like acyl-CoA dehydrogenase